MRRRLVKTGRSLAVPLPAAFIHKFGLKSGDGVDVQVDPRTGVLTIVPAINYFEGGKVTKRFRELAEKTMQRRKTVFERLAKS
jgi:antitoxin component of MazEF toxin-antitoxin module